MKMLPRILFGMLALSIVTQAHAMRWYSPSMGRWLSRGGIYPVWIMRLFRPDKVRYEDRVLATRALVKADGHTPAVDGFFDKVRPLSPETRRILAAADCYGAMREARPYRPVLDAPAAEAKAYEAALNQFKLGNYPLAISAFQGFLVTYPSSKLAPSAQYWIGNAHFAQRDYKQAVAAQQKVLAAWPDDGEDVGELDGLAGEGGADQGFRHAVAARPTPGRHGSRRVPGRDVRSPRPHG